MANKSKFAREQSDDSALVAQEIFDSDDDTADIDEIIKSGFIELARGGPSIDAKVRLQALEDLAEFRGLELRSKTKGRQIPQSGINFNFLQPASGSGQEFLKGAFQTMNRLAQSGQQSVTEQSLDSASSVVEMEADE